jgi:predicted MFS family arabinose efflux permease
MGTVMGAFSVASVLGVPVGLWFAEQFNWRAPFLGVAALGLVVCGAAIFMLPPLTGHLERAQQKVRAMELFGRPLVQLSYLMTAVVMVAGFVVIPNIASYLQLNLGFPRESLKYAYGVGGLGSLAATQLGGRAVDRFGSFRVGLGGAVLVVGIVYGIFYVPHHLVPQWVVLVTFVFFMMANGLRNVAYNTLATKVPPPALRARFQSLQSGVQHGASAFAAVLSSQLLSTVKEPGGGRHLEGMPAVALVSMGLTVLVPVLIRAVEAGVAREGKSH